MIKAHIWFEANFPEHTFLDLRGCSHKHTLVLLDVIKPFSSSTQLSWGWGGGGVGVTLIFSYICKLGSFFLVQNFEFQYFWGFSEKLIVLGV